MDLNELKKLTESIEVNEKEVISDIRWLSEGRHNGLDEAALSMIIRYLLKRNLYLEDRTDELQGYLKRMERDTNLC